MIEQLVLFPYYEPANRQQREFHKSLARHKLLIGGYGGGKSYPAYHEVSMHCMENPNHFTLIARNTWKDLEDTAWHDFIEIIEPQGIIKSKVFKSGDKLEITLINGHTVLFKPLTSSRDNLKGMHLCQFYLDDPNVKRYHDTISFLKSRLRNPPGVFATRFQSIITANWEGRDWLWKTYMKGRNEGGDGNDLVEMINNEGKLEMKPSGKAWWMCPTTGNKWLPETYIQDLAADHSKEWMDRYVFCKDVGKYSGLIYYDFDVKKHHMSRDHVLNVIGKEKALVRAMGVDVGGTHPTACIDAVTDGKNIYIIGEWVRKNCKISELGGYLQERRRTGKYRRFIIDPSSAKGEMTSGSNTKKDLHRNYNLSFENGINNVNLGIQTIQDMLLNANGEVRLFIDVVNCPRLVKGIEIYRWEDMKGMDLDDMEFEHKPRKKNDDEVDAMRYVIMWLRKFMRQVANNQEQMDQKYKRRLERLERLPYYVNNPRIREQHRIRMEYGRMGISKKRIDKILQEI